MIWEQNRFLVSPQNQRCYNVKFWRWFNVDKLTLFRRWKYGYLLNVDIKTLVFQASWYKNKIAFRVNPKSTLFQRWVLWMKQCWQIDVESTWISRWPTSRRYIDIYQRWINIECLLGNFTPQWFKKKSSLLLGHGIYSTRINFFLPSVYPTCNKTIATNAPQIIVATIVANFQFLDCLFIHLPF